MQPRPIRSQIYLPVLRFGLTDEDWGIVILAAIVGYAIPFWFGMKIHGVPLELMGWLAMMGLSVFILNLFRRNSRPGWVWHAVQARALGPVSRRRLPDDPTQRWLKEI